MPKMELDEILAGEAKGHARARSRPTAAHHYVVAGVAPNPEFDEGVCITKAHKRLREICEPTHTDLLNPRGVSPMPLRDIETQQDPCALIEGAGFGDANFYGMWLLAAAKAEALWKLIQHDEQFLGLTWGAIPDLSIGAIDILSSIQDNYCVVSLRPAEEMAEWPIMLEFVLMAELGLLSLAGNCYQMTIPAQEPDIDAVRAAALTLAETGDEESTAYPEHLITAMSRFEAERWHRQNNDASADGHHATYSRTYH